MQALSHNPHGPIGSPLRTQGPSCANERLHPAVDLELPPPPMRELEEGREGEKFRLRPRFPSEPTSGLPKVALPPSLGPGIRDSFFYFHFGPQPRL